MARSFDVLKAIVAEADRLGFLHQIRATLDENGVVRAVAEHDSARLYDWLVRMLSLQGISDAAAETFAAVHGHARYAEIEAALLSGTVTCPKLDGFSTFAGCGYGYGRGSCNVPEHYPLCPVPALPLRRGTLSQNAFHLYLFIRDVCRGDLVGWIDDTLATAARAGASGPELADSVCVPLTRVQGIARKVAALAMSGLLLGGDPDRSLWIAAGSEIVVIDTLVHNLLHRTGTLAEHDAAHPYGAGCYRPGRCEQLVRALADEIRAEADEPDSPANYPRLIQYALWHFCAVGEGNVCNGNRVRDDAPCTQQRCPVFRACRRMPLRSLPIPTAIEPEEGQ